MVNWKIIVLALSILSATAYGQGCSDAGFCTINAFKPIGEEPVESLDNQFKVGTFYGSADHSIAVYGAYFVYNRQINESLGIDVKLTSLAQSGNDISVFGLSDIFLNANYRLTDHLNVTLGAKVPLSGANKTLDGLALPMDYQASLGTFDLVLGLAYELQKIHFVVALQQPLTQNKNEFLASSYPAGSALSAFQSTNQFKRSGDILLRVSYPITLVEKLMLTPSILPIYHLANDKYTDESDVEMEIVGSQGLTLNGNLYLDYEINTKNHLQLNVGMPFVVRDARPDGLTRSLIANLEYKISF